MVAGFFVLFFCLEICFCRIFSGKYRQKDDWDLLLETGRGFLFPVRVTKMTNIFPFHKVNLLGRLISVLWFMLVQPITASTPATFLQVAFMDGSGRIFFRGAAILKERKSQRPSLLCLYSGRCFWWSCGMVTPDHIIVRWPFWLELLNFTMSGNAQIPHPN